jgi:hypothetical protein
MLSSLTFQPRCHESTLPRSLLALTDGVIETISINLFGRD